VIDERRKATDTLAAIGHEVIADDTASRLASQAQRLLDNVESVLLATPGPPATVDSLVGPVRVTDQLRATLLAMAAMGLHDGIDIPSGAIIESCRTLSAVLAEPTVVARSSFGYPLRARFNWRLLSRAPPTTGALHPMWPSPLLSPSCS